MGMLLTTRDAGSDCRSGVAEAAMSDDVGFCCAYTVVDSDDWRVLSRSQVQYAAHPLCDSM